MTFRVRILSLIGCLLAAAALAAAQDAPPVPPQPPAAPAPLVLPAPKPAPSPAPSADRLKLNKDLQSKAQEKLKEAQEKMVQAQQDLQVKLKDKLDRDFQAKAREKLMEAQEKMAQAQQDLQVKLKDQLDLQSNYLQDFNRYSAGYANGQSAYGAQELLAQAGILSNGIGSGGGIGSPFGSNSYERGLSALDQRRWADALQAFTQAATSGGERADGALYWKAYALNKLGRRDEALAAIADLRKSYAASRWLDDAKALELEVKQANGQPVSPESQSDDDLKLMAINGLMQSDPDRAIPALESLLKSAQSPNVKGRVLFVLAQSSSPKAQQSLEQVARGSANPDLQAKAIQYLGPRTTADRVFGVAKRSQDSQPKANNGQLLSEIYNSSGDVNVKRQIINSLAGNGDSDRLLQIAKTEKSADLRRDAVQRLTSLKNPGVTDALVSMYGSEQDKDVKRAIVNSFASQDNVKQLVAAARTEKDPEMARYIVSRLAGMKSPEAADYLMEILKK